MTITSFHPLSDSIRFKPDRRAVIPKNWLTINPEMRRRTYRLTGCPHEGTKTIAFAADLVREPCRLMKALSRAAAHRCRRPRQFNSPRHKFICWRSDLSAAKVAI